MSAIPLFLVPQYISIIGIEAYGLIALFTLIFNLSSIFDFGLSPAINIRFSELKSIGSKGEDRDFIRTFEIVYYFIALLLFLFFFFFRDIIASNMFKLKGVDSDLLESVLMIFAFIISIKWIEQFYKVILMSSQDHYWLSFYNLASSIFVWLGGYFVLRSSSDVLFYFRWQIIVTLFFMFLAIYRVYKSNGFFKYPKRITFKYFSEIKVSVFSFFISSLLVLGVTQVDKLIIAANMTVKSFSIYTLSFSLAASISYVVTPVTRSLLPYFAAHKLGANNDTLVKVYYKYSRNIAVLMFTTLTIYSFYSSEILVLWLKDMELVESVIPILNWLLVGVVFNALIAIPYNLQVANGLINLSNVLNSILLVFYIPLVIYCSPIYGIEGVAFLWMLFNIVYFFASIEFMHKKLLIGYKWSWYKYVFFDLILFILLIIILYKLIN